MRPGARQQAELANSFHQYHNAHGAFALTGTVRQGPVLLVDDVRGSGWTSPPSPGCSATPAPAPSTR